MRRRHLTSGGLVPLVSRLALAAADASPQQVRRLGQALRRAAPTAAAAALRRGALRRADVLGRLPLLLIAQALEPGRLAALASRLAVAAVPVERLPQRRERRLLVAAAGLLVPG